MLTNDERWDNKKNQPAISTKCKWWEPNRGGKTPRAINFVMRKRREMFLASGIVAQNKEKKKQDSNFDTFSSLSFYMVPAHQCNSLCYLTSSFSGVLSLTSLNKSEHSLVLNKRFTSRRSVVISY